MRVPRRLGLFLTGLAGIFGIRTPPEPQVIARMEPARPPRGPAPAAALPLDAAEEKELPD